jgi:penicillin-binding protein 1C
MALLAISKVRGHISRVPRRWKVAGGATLILALLIAFAAWRVIERRVALVTPSMTLLFEDTEGRFLAELSPDQHRMGFWPPPSVLPERLVKATLAAEDSRFFSHEGVDGRAVARALWQNLRHMRRVSGASTLAMQVARLQSPERRSLFNKAAESLVALGLTCRFGREAVLRHYLTIAPYGNQNYGAAYAARRYFDKPLVDLTWAEAAFLVSLPCMPGRMNVYTYAGWVASQRRARHVLFRLHQLGWMSEADCTQALKQLPAIALLPKETRPSSLLHAVIAMQKTLKADPASWGQRGPIVKTTLNLDVQRAVSTIASSAMQQFRADGAGNLAVMVAEVPSGHLLAYLGSEDYLDKDNKGAIDYARIPRSSGSTLKPFIYAMGMSEKGFTAATVLTDVGLALDSRTGGYTVKNYDETYLGPILYRNALANSRNVPAVHVLEAVGVEEAYNGLQRLGLVRRWRDPKNYGLTLAIGGLSVRLWDLVGAYGVLANEGKAFDLTWFPNPAPIAHPTQIISEDVARQITLFLSDPMARLPSFPRMGWLEYPFPVAVKTGTSKNYRDAWCVAYSRKYMVGVWVGHPDYYGMKRRCGADSAAMVVHKVMETLHPDEMAGLSDLSFPPPRGYAARRIDLLSGKLARQDTPYVAFEWFKPGTEPAEETDVYRNVTIDTRTGLPAADDCPKAFQREQQSVVLDPKFDRWANQSGLTVMPRPEERPDLFLKNLSPTLAVRFPKNGARFLPDPETPDRFATIALEASVQPPSAQVVWYVDGKLYEIADYPYSTRWKISPGTHTFRIGLPYAPLTSPPVRVTVVE